MRISLHLGAHKTASTYLQGILSRNAGRLGRRGHACFGPDRLRADLRLPSLGPGRRLQGAGFAPLAAALAQEAAAGRALLLSEENLIGTTRPGSIGRGAQLYPLAGDRLDRLLRGLQVQEAQLYLAVRSPLPFLVSAFGQQLMAGKLTDFDSYCAGVDPLALRWSELVARLVAVPRVAGITLWRHEDHAAVLPDVLARMFGPQTAATLRLPDRATHAGPSARAIDAAMATLRADPGAAPRKVMRQAMKRWPKSADHPGPMPFDAATLAGATAAYGADLAGLVGVQGVTVLDPAARQPASSVAVFTLH
ncbi:hypothetical protein HUK65_17645 [Rhodobacteraceae bacterium 2376]|uniref:Sulfotransferase family protein n=1 Tax=Rhabdonatronobacter sediminivivens TaxID=2743469 RepID=A0A7Z0I2M7_9RHOB|nr:hypothetical protein [Rhabdonatronobacter sediminivivens]NYS26793.1 hypothetical protein [Rhabdonatronobacter sediminivivens]